MDNKVVKIEPQLIIEEKGENLRATSSQSLDEHQDQTISRHQNKLDREKQIDGLNESLEQATIDDLSWHIKRGNECMEKSFKENKILVIVNIISKYGLFLFKFFRLAPTKSGYV